jgi:hypothetical protein
MYVWCLCLCMCVRAFLYVYVQLEALRRADNPPKKSYRLPTV